MITADTITDEQIREMRKEQPWLVADALRSGYPEVRKEARARLAEILNERTAEGGES